MEDRPADPSPEPGRGDVLESMRLVEHDDVVIGQHAAVASLAQPQVGEVERVVDDDEVGMLGPLPSRLREARRGELTRPPETAVGADCELTPQAVGRLDLELRPVTGLGRVQPAAEAVERASVLLPGDE
jgi:hypothetical protein